MEERAPLDRRSLQHTSKDLEGQIWAQIGTPQYNPPVAPVQASEATTTNKVNICTSPLESYKIPKLGSSTKAEETAKISSAGGDSRDDDSDTELHVDENAETVLVEAESEHSEPKESGAEEKPASKGEEEKSDKEEKENKDKESPAGDSYIDDVPYTSSNDPKLIKARVFIGQLNTSKCTKKDVEKVFAPYGKLLGVLLLHGYGFVQYEDEECAKKAIKEAHGAEICGSKIACDRPMALKQLLRDERRKRSMSPESKRRRERELLEELDYLRRRAQLDELDHHYYRDHFPDHPMRPPFRDPYFDPPFERSLPPPPPMDRYERMRMEELERARPRDRYPPPPPPSRPGLYDRPRDDPFDDRRPFHRDPFDHFDMPPPHRRF